jgi:hypothetical protein
VSAWRPLLLALAAAFAATALALRVWTPSADVASLPWIDTSDSVIVLVPDDSTAAERFVLANVFSARRTPPMSRYTPPESGSDSTGGMMSDSAMAGSPIDSLMMTEGAVPGLFGTVTTPEGARALLFLDPSLDGPRLYAVGDGAAGYRVVSIEPRVVIVRGPQGRVVLRMPDKEERP